MDDIPDYSLDNLPGYPYLPPSLPHSVVTPEWLRQRQIVVLRWQIANDKTIAVEPCRTDYAFLLRYYEEGGLPPPNDTTWLIRDGQFVMDANGEHVTMTALPMHISLKGYTIVYGLFHQGGQSVVPAQQAQQAQAAHQAAL